jgi:hypothetical protein
MAPKKRGAATQKITEVPSSRLQHHRSSEEDIQNENPSADAPRADTISHDIILAVIRKYWDITQMLDMIEEKTWTKGLKGTDVTWELETLHDFRDLAEVSKGKEVDVREKLRKRWEDRSHNHNGFSKAVGSTWSTKQSNLRVDLKWLKEKYQREAAVEVEKSVRSQDDLSEELRSEVDPPEVDQPEEQCGAATSEQNETTVFGRTRARTRGLQGMPSSEHRVTRRKRTQDPTEETRHAQTAMQSAHGDERMDVDGEGDHTSLQETQHPSPPQLPATQGQPAALPTHTPVSVQTTTLLGPSNASNQFELELAVSKRREREAELEVLQHKRDKTYLQPSTSAVDIAKAELAVTEAQERLARARTKILELQDYS